MQRYKDIINGDDMRKLKRQYFIDSESILENAYQMHPGLIYTGKSGGKIETKTSTNNNKLTVNDRLVLQGDKAAKRAVLQASNNLHKMLLKLMK